MLFDRQYILTEDVVVETRYRTETDTWTDEDGNSHTDTYQVPYDYYICTVTLENFDLSMCRICHERGAAFTVCHLYGNAGKPPRSVPRFSLCEQVHYRETR